MLAFVHIQKTAGQTVREILRKNFGGTHCDVYRGFDTLTLDDDAWSWIHRCYPTLKSIGGHNVVPRGRYLELENVRFFTFLRDPQARALSHYQFLVKRQTVSEPFIDWMEKNTNRQVKVLAGSENLELAIETLEARIGFTGMMESFNESLLMWRHWVGDAGFDIRYKPVNVARSNRLKEEILKDDVNVQALQESNSLDQQLYDYARKEIYPRQKAWLGDELDAQLKQFEQSLGRADNASLRNWYGRMKRNLLFRPGLKRRLARL